jgi:hypothetical protein
VDEAKRRSAAYEAERRRKAAELEERRYRSEIAQAQARRGRALEEHALELHSDLDKLEQYEQEIAAQTEVPFALTGPVIIIRFLFEFIVPPAVGIFAIVALLITADCSDDGLTAPLCRPPCLTARIVSHLLVAECMPSCVHRATRFNTSNTLSDQEIRWNHLRPKASC